MRTGVVLLLAVAIAGVALAGGAAADGIDPEEAEGPELLIETNIDNDHACTHDEFDDRTPLDAGDTPEDAPVVTDDHVIWNVTTDGGEGFVRFDNTEHESYPGLDSWTFYYADGDLEPTDGEVLETGDVPECGLDSYAEVETPEDGVFDLQLTSDDHDEGDDDIGVDSFELIDRSTDEDVADVHDDHWHGDLPEVETGEHLSLGATVEDADGEPIDLGSEEYDLGVALAEDASEGVVSLDEHGDHVHVDGEAGGETELVFQVLHEGDVAYETPGIDVAVADHDHDDGVESFELIDRDAEESVAYVHDDHWHGGLPEVETGEHLSLGATVEDADGEPIDLGSEEYDLGVTLAEDASEGVVSLDEHGDHVHVDGEAAGETELVFQVLHESDVAYETPGIDVAVADETDDSDDLISIDAPDSVAPGGAFEFEVEMSETAVGEIVVGSEDVEVTLEVVEDDGDTVLEPDSEEETVQVIDVDANVSTYTLAVDVAEATSGSGTISVATGDTVGGSDVTDEASATFDVESPVDGVSDELWVAVTGDGELTLSDVDDAINAYQADPGEATIHGVDIELADLGHLIQYYQHEAA